MIEIKVEDYIKSHKSISIVVNGVKEDSCVRDVFCPNEDIGEFIQKYINENYTKLFDDGVRENYLFFDNTNNI